jgi:hypothetical protein
MRSVLAKSLFATFLLIVFSGVVQAQEVVRTYDFEIDRWFEIDAVDGAVTLHRIRIDRKEDRLTKAALARPYNQQYLEPVRFQLDYSNGSSSKWDARVTVRWLDEEGRVIDGFSANETLQKKSARKIAQASVSTLKYGLARAKTLEVEVRFEP